MKYKIDLLMKTVDFCSEILLKIAMVGILVMMLLVVVDVALRATTGSSLLIAEEVCGYLLVLVAYLGMGETLKRKRHVRVQILDKVLTKKIKQRLYLILAFLAMFGLFVVCLRSIIMVARSYSRGVLVPGALLTPVFIPQMVVPIGLVVLFLQYAVELYRSSSKAKTLDLNSQSSVGGQHVES